MVFLGIAILLLCISICIVGIVMIHHADSLRFQIFEEVNAMRAPSERVGPDGFQARLAFLEMMFRHRSLFPDSDKPRLMWRYYVGGMIVMATPAMIWTLSNPLALIRVAN
jgi:ABC-type Fe3+-siderophore transport system permease subunit